MRKHKIIIEKKVEKFYHSYNFLWLIGQRIKTKQVFKNKSEYEWILRIK